MVNENFFQIQSFLPRNRFVELAQNAIQFFPVTAIIGPRQCGKSTLAKTIAAMFSQVHFFDLEDILDREKFLNPKLTLDPLEGLIVIDEIQQNPELFPYLRTLCDRFPNRRYLILGSASRDLIEKSSESLAGRIQYIELTPFQLIETNNQSALLKHGGFPRAYLSPTDDLSFQWRKSYIQSYLERDLPFFGIKMPSGELYRFWMMLTHYHGQLVNFSEIGVAIGMADQTVKRYVHILEQTFMVRLLKPWFENISKRQVKTPKLYLRDCGIYQALLNLHPRDFHVNPKIGVLWEGFALEEIIRHYNARFEECFFWRNSNQAELDLLLVFGEKRIGFEIKYSDHPKTTRSMWTTLKDLRLSEINIVIPVENTDYRIHEQVRVLSLDKLIQISP